MVSTPRSTQGPGNSYSRKYRSIAVGGTFDQIHKGHRALLSRAFDNGQQVFIGLTSDELAKKMGKNIRNDFAKRKSQLKRYIEENYAGRDYEISKLDAAFGPGIFTPAIEAIAVSEETLPNVAKANEKRRTLGLPDMKIEIVPLVLASDGRRISSTRIRAGEIDSEGRFLRNKEE
ncbi:MAG TPA: phosphopantetheine adenylyltransferase [Nitrososphaerales archaeon]|nr:phosphopantetheine adenylyltransferase [Nitrososphaerales archaeon]